MLFKLMSFNMHLNVMVLTSLLVSAKSCIVLLNKYIAKDVDICLFASEGRDNDIDENNESGKVFKEVRFVCAAPECQSTSGCHYLKHKKDQSCDQHLFCEK